MERSRWLIASRVGSASLLSGTAAGSSRSIWCSSPTSSDTRLEAGTIVAARLVTGLSAVAVIGSALACDRWWRRNARRTRRPAQTGAAG